MEGSTQFYEWMNQNQLSILIKIIPVVKTNVCYFYRFSNIKHLRVYLHVWQNIKQIRRENINYYQNEFVYNDVIKYPLNFCLLIHSP